MKKQYIIIVVAATVLTFLSAFIFNACKKVDFDPVTKSYIKDTHSIDTTSCTLYLKIHSLNPKFSHPDYGICYSSSNAEPSIDNNKIRFGAITDTLTKTVIVKNLKHGTRYYFRSFVMDEENAKYGDVISLTIPITVAKLTTNEVSNITATYASCGGNITSDGGSSITARGVCWSTSQNPTTSNSKTTIGSGFGSFKSAITGLTAGTTYYVRAYATNSVGTQYGNQVSFKTLVGVPSLTTKEISNITATSASCGGNITSDGGSSVTARGVCWSTSQNPTISSSHSTSVGGTGSFSSSITGLTANTTYYVRAYATNSIGTQYGNQLSFQTPFATGSFTDSRDGNVYKYLKIGSQTWMAENLKYLPSVVGSSTGSETKSYYYVYDYEGTNVSSAKATDNYKTYGVLYNWPAAKQSCPSGWHLPSDSEWIQMENYLADNGYNYDGTTGGGRDKIAKALASKSGWNSSSLTGGAVGNTDYSSYRNKTGFTALPGGYRNYNGYFDNLGSFGYWWSATESDSNNAWERHLYYDISNVYRSYYYKDDGFSVRCVRD